MANKIRQGKIIKGLKNGLKLLKRTFYPLNFTCNSCSREVFNGERFCASCQKDLIRNDGCICEVCGRKVPVKTSRCMACKGDWKVDMARSVYIYEGTAKNLIVSFKYFENQYLAEVLLPDLAEAYVKNHFCCDVIMGVPTTSETLFERGFNQSVLLAEALAKHFDIEVIAPLIKKNNTKEQASLSAKNRKKNLKSTFKIADKNCVKGKKVLIVDDVLTTGATSGEVARLLKSAGAEKVFLLTVASTVYEN